MFIYVYFSPGQIERFAEMLVHCGFRKCNPTDIVQWWTVTVHVIFIVRIASEGIGRSAILFRKYTFHRIFNHFLIFGFFWQTAVHLISSRSHAGDSWASLVVQGYCFYLVLINELMKLKHVQAGGRKGPHRQ